MERHYSQHGKEVVPAKDSISTISSISATKNQKNFLLPIHSELQMMDVGNEKQLKHGSVLLVLQCRKTQLRAPFVIFTWTNTFIKNCLNIS